MKDYGDLASMRRVFTSGPAVAPRPESCPVPETLWSALHGELPPAELRQVVDHTATCPACAEDWRLALAMEGEEDEEEEEEPIAWVSAHNGHLHRFRVWMTVPIAAAVASLITVAQWGMRQPLPMSAFRGQDQAVTGSSAPMKLSRRDGVLSWPAVPGAVSYEVIVDAKNGALDIQKAVNEPHLRLEPSQLERLPRGTEIRWTVDAILADGSRRQLPNFRSILE
jgi:anti-sigma factor RsiW